MKIAVEGCCHGHLDSIYTTLQRIQEKDGIIVDLLLCCGDFQAVRNCEDLNCMAVPNKYKTMGTFYKYYSGEKTAPILTIFIGGNHEASNHLRELGYGGWVAPNIYYIGYAGVVRCGGLRIGGISGIYKKYDYQKGHFEVPPYSQDTLRSAYHIRSCDVFRLKQLTGDIDIMMSHDWPLGIHRHGNYQQLFRIKPFFEEEADTELGSPPTMGLLQCLHPSYWFSGHLHCKFSAVYRHNDSFTKFLALDKCLPRGQFLQVLDVPSSPGPLVLEYDPEWLSILQCTESLMLYKPGTWYPPTSVPSYDVKLLEERFNHDFTIPSNFEITTTPHSDTTPVDFNTTACDRENPQTKELCAKLGIRNPWAPSVVKNPDEIDLSDDDDIDTERETTGQEKQYPWLVNSSSDNEQDKSCHDIGELEKKLLPNIVMSDDNEGKLHYENPDEINLDSSSDNETT